jgi:hypothetical protein
MNVIIASTYQINKAISFSNKKAKNVQFNNCLNHFNKIYVANAQTIIQIYIGTHTFADSHLSSCFRIFFLMEISKIIAITHHIRGDITQLAAINNI